MKNKAVGLDISDQTIEAVELGIEGKDIKVISLGRIILESGIVARGRIKDKDKLKQAIRQVLAQAQPAPIKTNSVNFALPDNQLYSHIFSCPGSGDLSADKIRAEVEKNIPMPTADLTFDYRILKKNVDRITIVLIACSQLVIKEWQDFFNELELEVVLFDAEALAAYRGIYDELPTQPVGIIDIGASTTNLAIFSELGLSFTASLPVAGNSFSKAIADGLKVDSRRAEELKIKNGLSGDRVIRDILAAQIKALIKEVAENIKYYEDKHKRTVRELILIGGSSQMPGLVSYISSLDLSNGIKIKLGQARIALPAKGFEYIEACGLALRELEAGWDKTDPAIMNQTANKSKKTGNILKSNYWTNQLIKINHKVLIGVLIGLPVTAIIIFIAFSGRIADTEIKPADIEASQRQPPDQAAARLDGPVNTGGEEPQKMIRIKPLSQNLNVRSGPGTNFSIIGQAVPLTEYPLLEEEAEWLKISLPDEQAGWVYASFTDKVTKN